MARTEMVEKVTAVASVLVGVAPVYVLASWWGVPTKITVGYGAFAWIVAVLLKVAIHHIFVEPAVRRGVSYKSISLFQGLLSSSTELGAAALLFWFFWQPDTLAELIGIGAGAGMVEAVILPFIGNPFKGTNLEDHYNDVTESSQGDPQIQWMSVLERVLATTIHISSRSLVYISILSTNPIPCLAALVGFSGVDGLAYYGHLQKWRFDSTRVLLRIYGVMGGIGLLLTGVFVLFAGLFNTSA